MYALTILFLSLPLLASLIGAQFTEHDICCNPTASNDTMHMCGPGDPPDQTFCCDVKSNADAGHGCDGNADFTLGRGVRLTLDTPCKSGNSVGVMLEGDDMKKLRTYSTEWRYAFVANHWWLVKSQLCLAKLKSSSHGDETFGISSASGVHDPVPVLVAAAFGVPTLVVGAHNPPTLAFAALGPHDLFWLALTVRNAAVHAHRARVGDVPSLRRSTSCRLRSRHSCIRRWRSFSKLPDMFSAF
ncbi:hypothetical protein LZ32DRAFT_616411 [Colletotrichum eremochloae]|nr:hypothetical protein LZ32DRAFT_616411 [Colletotrichum eremochloae]